MVYNGDPAQMLGQQPANSGGTWGSYSSTTLGEYWYNAQPQPWSSSRTVTWNDIGTHSLSDFLLKCQQNSHNNSLKEGIEMKKLYTVYLIYGADRDKPTVVVRRDVIAKDIEDAKVKSGIYAEVKAEWDSDYLTIYADEICDVKVKAKPSEVKTVDK
jgi:hypothetical protein